MGNSGSSHQQQVTLIEGPPHSWAHSFPRTTSFKVLPDRVPGQRLRLTDNGAILHNGGTISGRKPYPFEPQPKIQVKFSYNKGYRNGAVPHGDDYRRTLYGSEPDLRYPRDSPQSYGPPSHQSYYNNNNDNSVKARIGKSRKKYKAPLAPHINSTESSSPDSYHRWETSADSSEVTAPSRRSRLFKTRAETKRPSVDHASPKNFSQLQKPGAVPGMLQRSLSSPQFQDELTAKLRERAVREPPIGKAADSPHHSPVLKYRESISHQPRKEVSGRGYDACRKLNGKAHHVNEKLPYQNGSSKGHLQNGLSPKVCRVRNANDTMDVGRHRNGLVGKYVYRNSSSEKRETPPLPATTTTNTTTTTTSSAATKRMEKPAAPVKRFYFGMEGEAQPEPYENDESAEVDKFAASLRKVPLITETSPSDSYSSEPANFENPAGISLKLRPTLPRKQLDIPRFSPTAAWRLLSALESPTHSEEDDLVLMEEQIPHPQIDRQYTIKSADSGISGDTSPRHHDSTHNSQMAWTPQQDLEETSSDGGLESAPVSPESAGTAAKFAPRFSLSLPKEERTMAYSDKVYSDSYASSNFQNGGARKVKRSMSGAVNKNANEVAISSLDENWLLSRSVPNLGLFNNAYVRRWAESCPSTAEQDDEDPSGSLSKPSSLSYLANGGHIMYLPEYKNTLQKESLHNGATPAGLPPFSKSCDDLMPDRMNEHAHDLSHESTENDQRVVNGSNGSRSTSANNNNNNKLKSNRKFTFQSTIRQIERKKIAEKLSREAEEKERRRLRELEAMKKVEEEFQRKREREKADIRHQLRLYNLTEGAREQPDGAVLPPPARSTQVLSEFRQPRRDYRDYTPQRASDADSVSHSDLGVKRETVHPEVVYKMPKNAQVYVTPHHSHLGNGHNYLPSVDAPRSLATGNYRKDFAQGALPRSIASSDSELSQPNTRPMSRTKQRSSSSSPAEDDKLEENENDGIFPDPDYDTDDDDNVDELDMRHDNGRTNKHIANLINIFKPETPTRTKKITLQPYNRNKTYKPVPFKPSSDKIAQVIS